MSDPAQGDTPPRDPTAARPRRPLDAAITLGLLAAGVVSTISTFPELVDLAGTIDAAYRIQGIDGRVAATDAAAAVGFVLNVIRVAALLWSIALVVPRLRSGRIAFWIPLAAAAASTAAVVIGIGIIVIDDPAFLAYVDSISAGVMTPTPTP